MDDERLALAPVSRALIFARHSRAGGNPQLRNLLQWIPAPRLRGGKLYAGMTTFWKFFCMQNKSVQPLMCLRCI